MNSKIHIVIIAGLSLAMLQSTIVLSYGGHHVEALKTPKIWCFDTGVFGDVGSWSSKKDCREQQQTFPTSTKCFKE
jgi:hypothetical protein